MRNKQGFWPRINCSQMKLPDFKSPSGDSSSKSANVKNSLKNINLGAPPAITALIQESILMVRVAAAKGSVPCLMAMSTSLFLTAIRAIVFGLFNLICILLGIP